MPRLRGSGVKISEAEKIISYLHPVYYCLSILQSANLEALCLHPLSSSNVQPPAHSQRSPNARFFHACQNTPAMSVLDFFWMTDLLM